MMIKAKALRHSRQRGSPRLSYAGARRRYIAGALGDNFSSTRAACFNLISIHTHQPREISPPEKVSILSRRLQKADAASAAQYAIHASLHAAML